jgi:tetratricopeptide (TPR) repeat protein
MTWCARIAVTGLCSLLLGASGVAQNPSGSGQAAPAPNTQGAPAPKPRTSTPAKTAPGKKSSKAPATSAAFVAAQKAAEKAREENRLDDAVTLYFNAVQMQPDWTEGWWYLGTISYDQDRYQPARDAFKRVVMLAPTNAEAHAFLGLSLFRMKEYDQALTELLEARILNLPRTTDLGSAVRYHSAIIFCRMGQFESAGELLNEFVVEGNDSPRVIEAFGIAALRLPVLPSELPGEKRDAVMIAGRAQYFSAGRMMPAAKQAFIQLTVRYPEMPNVHYAYGVFLLNEEADTGIEELQKELRITPGHAQAMLQLAAEYTKRSDMESAKNWAQKSVETDPNNYATHKALGQVLLATGDTDGAIRELELGVKMAPESPALRFQLAKAYQKAGRVADAEQQRSEFTRLDRQLRARRAGSQSVGGAATPPEPSPNQQN